jgi:methylmalonyl-CoA mutase, N-terminal domain
VDTGAGRRIPPLGRGDTLIESGYFRRILTGAMDRHSSAVQNGELRIVGVNEHTISPEADRFLRDVAEERFEPDYAHVERIRAWRPSRRTAPLEAALERVGDASADPAAGLMAPIIAALDADATIGEITGCLREGQGLPGDPFEYAARRVPAGTRL